MTFLKRLLLLAVITLFSLVNIFAANEFVVRQIRVEGLQRISLNTVLHYLPIKQGQTLQPDQTGSIVSALYATGFFTNVNLTRQGDVLIINVQERPTIGSIKISGNKKIPTKQLNQVMQNIGIQEGNAYDSSILQGLQQSLQQQYYSQGQYNAKVSATATPQDRNRVAININIDEGKPAHIKSIKITGNHAFSERRLKFQLKETTWRPWTILTHSDQYSKDKFDADLETLHNYYLDRGYLRFKFNSANANMSPDNKNVNILIDVDEGPVYHIQGFNLNGNLLGQGAQVQQLIPLKKGEVFSRSKILAIDDLIKHYYGNQGYAFASVTPVPAIDDANHTVFIHFQVQPGPRVYVRNIDFTGNTKTQEYVLRREMRQEEGALYSLSNIEEGKRRLNLLGYLQNVDFKATPVPGTTDQVDLNYNVSEMSSATASIQGGYSDMYGFLYGANVTENNLLGTGKQVSLGFQNSQAADVYSLSYVNPYYTESGISRAITLSAQHVTPGNINNVVDYTTNAYGVNVSYGVPISEYSGINFGYGYQYIHIIPPSSSSESQQITNFINAHGQTFNQTSVNAGWQRTTYDRAFLPTSGTKQALVGEVGAPILSKYLEYYKLNYEAALYQPIARGFIVYLNGNVAYGNGYGAFGTEGLPFFKNYFAGGIDSVRGYQANTLGPLDSLGNPIGGNVLTTATASLIIPNPISDKLRTSLFVDGGNVFANQFQVGKVSYSAGFGVEFLIPMVGPLEFAISEPLNPGSSDQRDPFEFSVGTSF